MRKHMNIAVYAVRQPTTGPIKPWILSDRGDCQSICPYRAPACLSGSGCFLFIRAASVPISACDRLFCRYAPCDALQT